MATTTTITRDDEHDEIDAGTDRFAGQPESYKIDFTRSSTDRRAHRRHDLDRRGITVSRWDGTSRSPQPFGVLVDLSAGGIRVRTADAVIPVADGRIRVRLELPAYAGICPFIDTTGAKPRPTREWVGWMTVARTRAIAGTGETEVAGRLIGMADADRGMLGLYLSTQPLAA